MPNTLVDIEFPYLASFVRPRKRNGETAYFRGTMPVAISSVSASEAPIVCVIDPNPSRKDHELYLQEIRRHDGHFYLPETTDEHIPGVDLKLLQSAASKTGTAWTSNPFHDVAKRICEEPLRSPVRSLPEAGDIAIREVTRSWREEVEGAIKAEVSNFLLIDGVLHRTCPEPRLLVEYRHHGLETDAIFHDNYSRNRWVSAVFGVNEQDKIEKYVRGLIETGDVNEDYIQEGPAVLRVDPSVPWSDFSADSLSIYAPTVMERARKVAPWLPRAGIEAFVDMKEAYEAFKAGQRDRSVVGAFCAAYARMASHCTDAELTHVDDDPETARGHSHAFDLARDCGRGLLRFRVDGLVDEPELPAEAAEALAALGS